jgi:hypothetical protein
MVFGWVACVLGLLRVRRSMEAQKAQEEMLDQVRMNFSIFFSPILHMWLRDRCFTCDGSSTIQVFTLLFNIAMVISPYTKFSSKWVKVMLPYRGEGCLYWGVGQSANSKCWLCNYSKYSTLLCDGF